MDYMQYVYVFLWGIIAVIMFSMTKKEGIMAFLIGLFFTFMTVWYALRAFGGIAMFEGTLGIIFKVVMAVFLLFLIGFYLLTHRKGR